MGRIFCRVIKFLLCNDRSGFQAVIVGISVEVTQVIRVVAARDLHTDSMPNLEDIPSRPPELDVVFIDPVRFYIREIVGIESAVILRIPISSANHTVT